MWRRASVLVWMLVACREEVSPVAEIRPEVEEPPRNPAATAPPKVAEIRPEVEEPPRNPAATAPPKVAGIRPEVEEPPRNPAAAAPPKVEARPAPAAPKQSAGGKQPPEDPPLPEETAERPPRDAEVRVVHAACGENTRGGGAVATRVTPRRNGDAVRLRISDLAYYCSPAPRFTARVVGDVLEVRVLRPSPGVPVARCVCFHDASLSVADVPDEVVRVRLLDDDGSVVAEGDLGGSPPASATERAAPAAARTLAGRPDFEERVHEMS